MPTYEITSPSGKKLRVTGDNPPSQQEIEQIFSQFEVKPERTISEKIGGAAEAGLAMATGAIAEPIAGLKGLARTAWAGPEAGAAEVERTRQALTYQPGEAGQEYLQDVAELPIISDIAQTFERGSKYAGQQAMNITGSPAVAAVAEALPAAGAAYLGARTPAGAADRLSAKSQSANVDASKLGRFADGELDTEKPSTSMTSESLKRLSDKTYTQKDVRDIADVDPEFFKAMEEVGVTADPLTSYASRNPQFRGIEQGLAAMPGSNLAPAEQAFRKNLTDSAANLLRQYGALEGGEASIKWRDSTSKVIDDLGADAQKAYDTLGERLDQRQQANPVSTMEFITARTENLPLGITDPSAPDALKNAFVQLQPRKRTNPETGEVESIPANYASMDTLRKEIGAAAFKKEGRFREENSALLKQLYSSLTDDLNAMAEAQGLVDEVKQAKAVVTKRKVLEDQMQALLGDKLQKDIEPVVAGAVKELAKGGIQKYKAVMDNIPETETRQQLVMTSLNNIFTGTRAGEKGDFLTAKYLEWYNNTLGKPALRGVIERDLPEGAANKLDALAKIAEGVTRAKADKVKTGAINGLLDDKAGMVRRMVGGTVQQTVGRLPGPTAEVASAIGSALKADTKRSAAVGEILSSPEFAYLIRRGVAEGVVTGNKASKALQQAEQKFMKSKKYQAWADTLSSEELQAISSVGLTSFLTSQQQEAKQ